MDYVDVILIVLFVGVVWIFIAMRGESKVEKPIAYWKLVLLAFLGTFVTALVTHRLSLKATMASAWAASALGCSIGFCIAESARRYRAKH